MIGRSRLRALGSGAVARASAWSSYLTFGIHQRQREFSLQGRSYRYHAGRYNEAWRNERTIEVPVILAALRDRPAARVLELGNVLAHYGITGHMVVDKYERAPGVINRDVLELEDPDGFDLIVSISTLEHTGFEEEVSEPEKPAVVMAHLAGLLRPGGRLLVTFPLGYNSSLDALVRSGDSRFGELRFLRRCSRDNRWEETRLDQLARVRYGAPFPAANAVVVAERTRETQTARQ